MQGAPSKKRRPGFSSRYSNSPVAGWKVTSGGAGVNPALLCWPCSVSRRGVPARYAAPQGTQPSFGCSLWPKERTLFPPTIPSRLATGHPRCNLGRNATPAPEPNVGLVHTLLALAALSSRVVEAMRADSAPPRLHRSPQRAPPPGGGPSRRPWTFLTHAPGGIRTHDPQLRRLQLYPTELPAPTDAI